MSVRSLRRPIGALAVGASALIVAATLGAPSDAAPAAAKPKPDRYQPIQILSFNDFHGNLEAPGGSSGRIVVGHHFDATTNKFVDDTQDTGGVEYLATHLKQAREGHADSLTVAAGDIIGASPLLSAAFHDEPTIDAMNTLGLDVSSVGNHEFDEGYLELQRMANGGCLNDGDGANNQNSCPGDTTFGGANFDYLAANVVYAGTNKTILPAYTIKDLHGAKIGFIGMTLKGTPDIVTAAGVKGLAFTDEVKAANKLVPVLKSKGVKAIVVLIHQGGIPAPEQIKNPVTGNLDNVNPRYDYTCAKGGSLIAAQSPILPIAAKLDPEIDMVVSGHTHQPYVCDVKDPKGQDRLLTSASSFGRLYTDTELTYDRTERDIVRASVKGMNMPVTRTVAKDAGETALIAKYQTLVADIASKVIGHITTDVKSQPPVGSTNGESQLGDLIADAQLADPSVVTNGRTPTIAFMNPGGIRADLTYANSKYGEPAGDVTYEEAFTVQPFNNYLVSMDVTGQDIYDLLAQQVTGSNAAGQKILQISQGFTYKLTSTGAEDGSVLLNGTPIDKAATYRIVTNNFLQGGGDGFPSFTKGTDVYYGGLDIDAFANYLSAHSPYTPGALTRITQ